MSITWNTAAKVFHEKEFWMKQKHTKTKTQWSLILMYWLYKDKDFSTIICISYRTAQSIFYSTTRFIRQINWQTIPRRVLECRICCAISAITSSLVIKITGGISADKEQEVLFEPFENSRSTRRWVLLETVQRRSSTEEDNHLQILPTYCTSCRATRTRRSCSSSPLLHSSRHAARNSDRPRKNCYEFMVWMFYCGTGSSGPRGKTLISLNRLIKTLQHSYSNRSAKWRVCCAALTHQTSSARALTDLSYLVAVLSNQAHTDSSVPQEQNSLGNHMGRK